MRDSFNYPQAVEQIFAESDLNYEKLEQDDEILFAVPMPAKNAAGGLKVFLHVNDFGSCKIRSYIVRDVSERKFPAMLAVINDLNLKYRYITLSIDSDGDVLAAYDFSLFGEDLELIEQNVMHLLVLVSKVIDNCIKPLMKVVWFDDEDDD